MADQRLPIVNSDDGIWGDIIRQYLMKEHYNDDTNNAANGGHQRVTIRPGTASAGTAPLKFTSGTLLSAPEVGAVEFNSDTLFFTQSTGTTRKKIATYDDASGALGDIYYRNSGGLLTKLGIGNANDLLGISAGVPAWTPNFTVKDANFTIQDDVDASKQVKLQVSSVSTGTTRTLTVPNASGTLALTSDVTSSRTVVNVVDYGAVGDNVTDNTPAIAAAQAAVGSYGTVWFPAGTYRHTGLTVAAGVQLKGSGRGRTILRNTSNSSISITMHGTPGGPYLPGASLESLTIDATARNSGQIGVSVRLAQSIRVADVEVMTHGIGIQHHASWENLYHDVHIHDCDTGWFIPVPGSFTSSCPVTMVACHAVDCTIGFQVDDGVQSLSWTGGDFSRCGTGVILDGNQTGQITFEGINFEGISGDDVKVGSASYGPAAITFIGCRFFWASTAKTRSIYFQRGDQLVFNTCRWTNAELVARQDSSTGTLTMIGGEAFGNTHFIDLNGTYADSVSAIMVSTSGKGVSSLGPGGDTKVNTISAAQWLKTNVLYGAGKTTVADADFTTPPIEGSIVGVYNTTDNTFRLAARHFGAWVTMQANSTNLDAWALKLAPSGAVVGTTDTQGLSNKRIASRVVAVAQSATPAINTDNTDVAVITGLAQAITSMTTNLSGTPVAGDRLRVEIVDNGTARSINWGAKFDPGYPFWLPSTTLSSQRLICEFVWNVSTSVWRLQTVNGGVTAMNINNIDLGGQGITDTTLARGAAGRITVAGVNVPTISSVDIITNKTLTAPKFASGGFIADNNGNESLRFTTTASAVNDVTIVNAIAGGTPTIQASGDDTNINLNIASKGTAAVFVNNQAIATQFNSMGLSSKVLDNSNTYAARETAFTLNDAADTTKLAQFDVPATQTTNTTAVHILPPASSTLASLAGVETLSGKTLTSPTLTTPRITNAGSINDNNGNEQIVFTTTASAVNEIGITNAATGVSPQITARGGDTNVDLRLAGKGTGVVMVNGSFPAASISKTLAPSTGTETAQTNHHYQTWYPNGNTAVRTLPTAVGNSSIYSYRNNHSAAQTINSTSSQTFDGIASPYLLQPGEYVVFASDNANWRKIGGAGNENLSNKTLISPKITNGIYDSSGAAVVAINGTASAVNYFGLYNSAAGENPGFYAAGTDTNVGINLGTKGTGVINVSVPSGQDATIQAAGAGSNINLNLLSKGTGKVRANNVEVVDISTFQTITNKWLMSPVIGNAILTTFGNTVLALNEGGSANYLGIANAASGVAPTLSVSGSDTNVDLNLAPKGAGLVKASGNLSANTYITGTSTTATTGGVTTLTITSPGVQIFTGSSTQTVRLPTTSVVAGAQYTIINQSTGILSVQSSGMNTISTLASNSSAIFTSLTATPTTSAHWNSTYTPAAAAAATGSFLQSARAATNGSESYTIVSGTVTQIAGTTIDGVGISVGERILIKNAPVSSGAGSAGGSFQPGNGVYIVTNNSSNLTVSRAADMSGNNTPVGAVIAIISGTGSGGWIFMVDSPTSTVGFTYGSTQIVFGNNIANNTAVINYVNSAAATLTNKTISTASNVIEGIAWAPEMIVSSGAVIDGFNDMPGGISVEPGPNATGVYLDSVWVRIGDLASINSGGNLVIDVYSGTATTQGSLVVSVTLASGSNNQIATLGTPASISGNAVIRVNLTKGSSTLAKPLHVQLRGRYKG